MTEDLTEVVAYAVKAAPVSLRRLAREADVSPALLSRICSGERNATPEVAAAIADALDRLAGGCQALARRIRRVRKRNRRRRRT